MPLLAQTFSINAAGVGAFMGLFGLVSALMGAAMVFQAMKSKQAEHEKALDAIEAERKAQQIDVLAAIDRVKDEFKEAFAEHRKEVAEDRKEDREETRRLRSDHEGLKVHVSDLKVTLAKLGQRIGLRHETPDPGRYGPTKPSR